MTSIQIIKRCNELAIRGLGYTATNPNVGAVVYNHHENNILGEGYHQKYGSAHAEVNAINACHTESFDKNTEIAVSLEPCNHFGKTPPCTLKIRNASINRVMVDQLDINPLMQGKSLEALRKHNIEVQGPINSNLGKQVLRPFYVQQTQTRPYIVIKMAISQDGYIGKEGQQTKISNKLSDRWVHRWRSEVDAILVGGNTLKNDNPSLNSRYHNIKNPIRVIVDKKNDLSPDLNIFKISGKNIIFNKERRSNNTNSKFITSSDLSMNNVMQLLYRENIGSLMVEGGSKTVNEFLSQQLWDEIRIIQNNKLLISNGVKAPDLFAMGRITFTKQLGNDTVYIIEK